MPAKDGADDKGGARPRNQEGAGFGTAEWAVIIQDFGGGFGFGGCGDGVGCGVVVVRDGFRVDLVGSHDGGWLFSSSRDDVVVSIRRL